MTIPTHDSISIKALNNEPLTTATYLADENCLQEESQMDRPAIEDYAWYHEFDEAYEKYNAHLASLRRISCSPECKGLWADQQKVVEGVDYKLDWDFTKGTGNDLVAFPLVPVKSEEQDALWRDVYAEAEAAIDWQYQEINDKKLIAILKSKYIITKR